MKIWRLDADQSKQFTAGEGVGDQGGEYICTTYIPSTSSYRQSLHRFLLEVVTHRAIINLDTAVIYIRNGTISSSIGDRQKRKHNVYPEMLLTSEMIQKEGLRV